MLTATHRQAMLEAAERLESHDVLSELPATDEQLADDEKGRDARLFLISQGISFGNSIADKALDWWNVGDKDLVELVDKIEPVLAKHDIDAPDWLKEYKEELELAKLIGAIGFEQWRNREIWLEEQRVKNAKDVTPKADEEQQAESEGVQYGGA